MRISAFTFALLLIGVLVTAQPNKKLSATISGAIHVPSMFQMNITTSGSTTFSFDNWEAFTNGILKPAAIHATVKGTRPWIISVKTISADNLSEKISNQFLKIKETNREEFVSLNKYPQTLYVNSNTLIVNQLAFDLKMESPLDHKMGTYATMLVFTLSSQ